MLKPLLNDSSGESLRSDEQIVKALRKAGFLLPETDEELESFDRIVEESRSPIPEKFTDPFEIIKNGIVKITNVPVFELGSQVEEYLAQAAREGRDIPQEIIDKMEQDRRDAEDRNNPE